MIEPVAALLQGRGHPVVRAKEAGLARASDAEVVAYALSLRLVLVTFDPDLRDSGIRGNCPVLHIRHPERTARARVAKHYRAIAAMVGEGHALVTLPGTGPPRADPGRHAEEDPSADQRPSPPGSSWDAIERGRSRGQIAGWTSSRQPGLTS